ncbi:phosphatidylinositol mannoside acyltransferase [Actinotalea sp. AC32]|nr:phosphatidylinositol mannoside acyltransferase [Actinotalea sp. AC32]
MTVDGSRLFVSAWRLAGRLPEPVVRAALAAGAEAATLLRGSGVRRLEQNLRRARPDASPRELRRLARRGMRTYMRYYAEAFTLPGLAWDRVEARVRVEGDDAVRAVLAEGGSVVLALAHQGNWDLAGAWATRALGPVTTVAERLEPAEVFDEFLALREGIGLRILPLDRGGEVFRELVRTVRAGGVVVPLLADRDLTASGVEVELLGERARVAAGPAALAVTTGAPLMATSIQHERLRGARRRAAGARWGIVIRFLPVEVVPGTPRAERVAALTQGWVDVLGAEIARDPTHWHMLQRVFVADLDPERYAAVRAAGDAAARRGPEQGTGGPGGRPGGVADEVTP